MTSNVTIASCPSCSCPIQATLSIKTEAKGEMKPDAEGNVVITGRVTGARIASHDCVPKVTR